MYIIFRDVGRPSASLMLIPFGQSDSGYVQVSILIKDSCDGSRGRFEILSDIVQLSYLRRKHSRSNS